MALFDKEIGRECALDITGQSEGACSPPPVIKQIAEHTEAEGLSPEAVIEHAKAKTGCETEKCVVKNTLGSDSNDVLSKHFKPIGPHNTTTWLNNHNIDQSLAQWKAQNPKFFHVPFQMIDFQEPPATELGKLDMVKLIQEGYDTMGCAVNTDVRSGGGIHWFGIFCDFRGPSFTLEYFNSSGVLPYPEIHAWLVETQHEINNANIGKKCDIVIASRIVHQTSTSSECGNYTLYYIYSRLRGVPQSAFEHKRVPDEDMIEFRKALFSKD